MLYDERLSSKDKVSILITIIAFEMTTAVDFVLSTIRFFLVINLEIICALFNIIRDEQSRSFTYTDVWDADKIAGCQCDSPMAGYDCSQQLCPSGDDPLTTGQVNEIQLLRCIATQGAFTLFYK